MLRKSSAFTLPQVTICPPFECVCYILGEEMYDMFVGVGSEKAWHAYQKAFRFFYFLKKVMSKACV